MSWGKDEKIHLLVNCDITGTIWKKIAYCGKSMIRKNNRTLNIRKVTCKDCLINRKLCKSCYRLSNNKCSSTHEAEWYFHLQLPLSGDKNFTRKAEIGRCSEYLNKKDGKKKYANSARGLTFRDKEDIRIANKRTHADRMNSYRHGYGYNDS